ncbi:MAG: sortase [Anaerolineae bacterium]
MSHFIFSTRPLWNLCFTSLTGLPIQPPQSRLTHRLCRSPMLLGWFLTLFLLHPIVTPAVFASEPAATPATQLVIPSIELSSAVTPVGWREVKIKGQTYGQWLVDDNLVGWHNLSARPGQVGNTVLNGHSNIHAQVFRHLPEVEIGDDILLWADGQPHHYMISQKLVVLEKGASLQQRIENAKLLLPTSDERLTLITCFGPEAAYRLIVIAHPVKL